MIILRGAICLAWTQRCPVSHRDTRITMQQSAVSTLLLLLNLRTPAFGSSTGSAPPSGCANPGKAKTSAEKGVGREEREGAMAKKEVGGASTRHNTGQRWHDWKCMKRAIQKRVMGSSRNAAPANQTHRWPTTDCHRAPFGDFLYTRASNGVGPFCEGHIKLGDFRSVRSQAGGFR